MSPVAPDIEAAIVAQNEIVNFNPDHESSILDVEGATGRVGARAPRDSYAKLLRIDKSEIGEIQKRYIVDGR